MQDFTYTDEPNYLVKYFTIMLLHADEIGATIYLHNLTARQ